LNQIIKDLDLKDIDAEHVRMEDYSRLNEEKYDYITARAVAHLGVISEISVRALKVDGHLVFMKGNCEEELEQFLIHSKDLGLVVDNINKFKLPKEDSNRTIINLKKVSITKDKYPRRIDVIKQDYK
jgi:16S rRNA (guanine527-N7)-methyltransferase